MRRAAKVDGNQAAIIARFRELYCSVQDLSGVGRGVPDILVGLLNGRGERVNVLVEIKSATGKLTPAQVKWHREWSGQKCIVRSVEEASALVEDIRRTA